MRSACRAAHEQRGAALTSFWLITTRAHSFIALSHSCSRKAGLQRAALLLEYTSRVRLSSLPLPIAERGEI